MKKTKAVSIKTHGFLVCPRARGVILFCTLKCARSKSLSARAWAMCGNKLSGGFKSASLSARAWAMYHLSDANNLSPRLSRVRQNLRLFNCLNVSAGVEGSRPAKSYLSAIRNFASFWLATHAPPRLCLLLRRANNRSSVAGNHARNLLSSQPG